MKTIESLLITESLNGLLATIRQMETNVQELGVTDLVENYRTKINECIQAYKAQIQRIQQSEASAYETPEAIRAFEAQLDGLHAITMQISQLVHELDQEVACLLAVRQDEVLQ